MTTQLPFPFDEEYTIPHAQQTRLPDRFHLPRNKNLQHPSREIAGVRPDTQLFKQGVEAGKGISGGGGVGDYERVPEVVEEGGELALVIHFQGWDGTEGVWKRTQKKEQGACLRFDSRRQRQGVVGWFGGSTGESQGKGREGTKVLMDAFGPDSCGLGGEGLGGGMGLLAWFSLGRRGGSGW